jgi:hypothetical protein
MKPRYCYWSVCGGSYGALMEMCVRSARAAGVFKEFHLLTDRPLEGCECYDAYQFEKSCGLFKLHYLKVGMSRLNFDYFAWVDADSLFMRNPIDLLGALGKSPIHVPLELNLSAIGEDHQWRGVSVFELRDLFRKQGITNQVYLSGSAFWIVHHDVIDSIYELAMGFWHKGKEIGLVLDVAASLGFAMQILCADPEPHLLENQPALWAGDEIGLFAGRIPSGPWTWRGPLGNQEVRVQPAIVHVPHSKSAGLKDES